MNWHHLIITLDQRSVPEQLSANDDVDEPVLASVMELQDCFQPSATPLDNPRRYFVWNNSGVIISRFDDSITSIDVEFHDTEKHRSVLATDQYLAVCIIVFAFLIYVNYPRLHILRPIHMIDSFDFTMGSMCEHAFVLAAPTRASTIEKEGRTSVIFVRNIDHWGSDDQWHLFFPEGEDIMVCLLLHRTILSMR